MINRIGITGLLNVGKDTLFTLLSQKLYCCKRVSLADQLRREMNSFILDKFGIDLFNCSREEKNLVRPLLVEYARIKRGETKGRYFINKISNYVESSSSTVVISDIRYLEEYRWLKDELKGVLVHISKYNEIDGKRVFAESPIADERENDPKLKELADYKIEWPQVEDKNLDLLAPYADNLLTWLTQNSK